MFHDQSWVPLLKTIHMKNCLGSNFRRESQGNEEDNFFLNPLVVQVATGVKQVALQNWKALQKTLDFSFLAARFLFPLFFWVVRRILFSTV